MDLGACGGGMLLGFEQLVIIKDWDRGQEVQGPSSFMPCPSPMAQGTIWRELERGKSKHFGEGKVFFLLSFSKEF